YSSHPSARCCRLLLWIREYKPMGARKKGHCSMTKLTGRRFTVREDPMAAISRRGFAIHLSAETRPWLCPSGVFACKALLIGSELPHFLAPAVLLFPIHAGPPAAGLPLDTQCPASGDSSRYLLQAPLLSPAA